MAASQPSVQGVCSFAAGSYLVVVTSNTASLGLRVQDTVTQQDWAQEYTKPYIEELTRKTGSAKTFPVFTRMLQTAVQGRSSSVVLELHTFEDLQQLRNQKIGLPHPKGQYHGLNGAQLPESNPLKSKRYLLMTYSSEFDRVHYPLPLTLTKEPDVRSLHGIIAHLRQQLQDQQQRQLHTTSAKLSSQGQEAVILRDTPPSSSSEVVHLRRENERLLREQKVLHAELEAASERVRALETGRGLEGDGKKHRKEVSILKTVVSNLESDLLEEKNRCHRLLQKKRAHCEDLETELAALRSSERSLRTRCRSLMNELSVRKRSAATPPSRRLPRGKRSLSADTPRRQRERSEERRLANNSREGKG